NSYLTGRSQYVVLHNKSSSALPISCGVPQGSILGPLLFLVYVNDLPKSVPILDVIMYADDTNLFFSHKNLLALHTTLQEQLNLLQDWLHANKLSLNVKKTKYIVFGKKVDMETLPLALPALTMNGQSIKRVYSMKFLGVLLDEHLTWQAHINNVEAKVSKSIGIIAKARKYLNLKALKTLYFSFIHPYITYGNVAWASTFRTKLQKIHRLQKRDIRVMTHSSRITHSRPLMQEHSILNVYEVNILQTLSFIFKHRINKVPVIFSTWFTRIHHGYNSRLAEFGYQE
ncbi:hypothetical protein KC960_05680, partial [Candidatus Saccharibacteria bacterium]|nr:hypothetical protein [Candidatus Saccharibacteria bacterium]